jgi:hypothetical protein
MDIQLVNETQKKEFEDSDTKGVIRIRKSKNRQHNGKKKSTKEQQRSTKHTHTTEFVSGQRSG